MHFPTDQDHLLLVHGAHRKYGNFYALQRLESVIKCAREILKKPSCTYTYSRALSIDEIYEINQGRPWSSVPYPHINIVQPIESEDIYAEQNRTPRRIGVEGLTPQIIQKRRQSCPEELLTVPLTKDEKKILRKHGLAAKRARKSFNISTRSRMIQDMRDKLHEQKLKNEQTIKKLSERC